MANAIKPEDRFDGKEQFLAWKFKIMITLEDNDVIQFVDKESKRPDVDPHKKLTGLKETRKP